jgi:hypothetical protein
LALFIAIADGVRVMFALRDSQLPSVSFFFRVVGEKPVSHYDRNFLAHICWLRMRSSFKPVVPAKLGVSDFDFVFDFFSHQKKRAPLLCY